jgi:hypothetical protein
MSSFPYTKYNDAYPIPIANLYLSNPNDNFRSIVSNPGILDTGADYTILPLELVRDRLQLKPINPQRSIYFKGVGSDRFESPLFRVGLSFDDRIYIKVLVAVLPSKKIDGEIIVGRNVLNQYAINFDGPKLVFTISD